MLVSVLHLDLNPYVINRSFLISATVMIFNFVQWNHWKDPPQFSGLSEVQKLDPAIEAKCVKVYKV